MTDFVPLLRTMISSDREHRRGESDYLAPKLRDNFRNQLIQEIEDRGPQMPRSDMWYLRYYREPYMSTFSSQQFGSRWADIQDNLMELGPNLKVRPASAEKKPQWAERFSELLAESQFRGGISSDLDQPISTKRFADNISEALRHIDPNLWEKNYIFKFGQKKYNEASLKTGTIRMVRSGRYSASDMNKAQKDEENDFTFSVMPNFLKNLDGMSGFSEFDRHIFRNGINIQFSSQQQYLVWCAASSYDPRIPYAFDYDSVLIIRDSKRFEREVSYALQELNNNWRIRSGRVSYYDPYIDLERNVDIPFTKHFRFTYQDEYRVVVQGLEPPEELFLKIPKLSQYSILLEL